MEKVNVSEFYILHTAFKPTLKPNSASLLIFKVFIIVFLTFVITIVIHKYSSFVDSTNEEKTKRIRQDKVGNFIEKFTNMEEGFATTAHEKEPDTAEYLWEKDTNPFSFNSNSVFQKRYGFLDEKNDSVENYQEGFERAQIEGFQEGGMFDFITRPINDMIDGIRFIIDKVREGFEWLSQIDKWVDDTIIKPTRSWFQNIFDELTKLKERFVKLGYGIQDLFVAFGNTFVTLYNMTVMEVTDVFNLIVGGGKCTVHFLNNFRSCLVFYLFDALVSILYHLFMLIPWMIDSISKTHTVDMVHKVYTYIEKVDNMIKKILGLSLIHYPKSVINTCYKCRDVNFSRLVDQLYSDNAKIESSFRDLGQQYKKAGYGIGGFFMP